LISRAANGSPFHVAFYVARTRREKEKLKRNQW